MLKSLDGKNCAEKARVIICYPFSVIGKTSVVGQAFLLANSDSRDGKRERLPYSEPLRARDTRATTEQWNRRAGILSEQ
jgi:hypothetical protein